MAVSPSPDDLFERAERACLESRLIRAETQRHLARMAGSLERILRRMDQPLPEGSGRRADRT